MSILKYFKNTPGRPPDRTGLSLLLRVRVEVTRVTGIWFIGEVASEALINLYAVIWKSISFLELVKRSDWKVVCSRGI